MRDPEQRISMKELAEHPWIVGFGPVQPLLLPSAADGGSAANAGGTQTVNGAPAPSPLRVVKQVSEQGDGAGGSAYGERTRSRMAAAAMVPPHSSAAAAAAAGYTARTFAPQPGGYGTTPPAIGSLSRAVAAAATPAPQPANVQNHYVESGTPGDTVRVHKLLASAVAVPTRTPELGATTPSPALAKGAAAAAAAAGSSSTGNGTGRAVASTAAAAVPSPDPRLPLPPATYSATTPVSYNTTVTTSGGVGGVGGGKPPLSQPRGAAPASATPTAMRTHLQQAASPLPAAAAVQPVLISTSMLPRRAAAASPVIMAATMSGSAAPLAATSVAVAGGGGLRADSPYLSTAATVVDMAAQRVRRASADYPSRVTGAASPALAATGVMGTPVGAAAASGALYPAPWHEICRQPQAGYAVAMARAAAAARDRQQAAAAAAASRRASEATGNKATTGARLLPGPTALGVAADQSQQDASAQGAASLLPFAADPTTEPPPAAGVAVGTPCVFMPQQPVAALGTRIIPAPRGPAPPYAGMITPLPGAAAGAAAAGGGGGYNHHHLGGVLTLPAEPVPRNQLQFAPTPVPPAPEMHRGGGGGPSLQEEDSTQGLLMSHAAAGSGGHGAAGSGSSSSAGGGSSAPVGKLR